LAAAYKARHVNRWQIKLH